MKLKPKISSDKSVIALIKQLRTAKWSEPLGSCPAISVQILIDGGTILSHWGDETLGSWVSAAEVQGGRGPPGFSYIVHS